jgi:hypothetical protein
LAFLDQCFFCRHLPFRQSYPAFLLFLPSPPLPEPKKVLPTRACPTSVEADLTRVNAPISECTRVMTRVGEKPAVAGRRGWVMPRVKTLQSHHEPWFLVMSPKAALALVLVLVLSLSPYHSPAPPICVYNALTRFLVFGSPDISPLPTPNYCGVSGAEGAVCRVLYRIIQMQHSARGMYVHVHACMLHVHACTHTYTYIHVYTCIYIYIHVCIYIHTHTHTYIYIYMYIRPSPQP